MCTVETTQCVHLYDAPGHKRAKDLRRAEVGSKEQIRSQAELTAVIKSPAFVFNTQQRVLS